MVCRKHLRKKALRDWAKSLSSSSDAESSPNAFKIRVQSSNRLCLGQTSRRRLSRAEQCRVGQSQLPFALAAHDQRVLLMHHRLGNAQNIQPFATAELDYRYGKEPFAVYTFRYRSHSTYQPLLLFCSTDEEQEISRSKVSSSAAQRRFLSKIATPKT